MALNKQISLDEIDCCLQGNTIISHLIAAIAALLLRIDFVGSPSG